MEQTTLKSAEINAKTLADLEQVTTAAIALEHHLSSNGGVKNSEIKQSIDQILDFCTQLSQTLPSLSAANPSFLEDIQAVVAMLRIQWRDATVSKVIFQMITDILRHVLDADRVMVMELGIGNEGKVLMESLGDGWTPTMGDILPLSYLGISGKLVDLEAAIATEQAELVTTISLQSNLSPYQHQLLEKYQVKSSISYGIVLRDRLWGFMTVQACQQEHQWNSIEREWLRQLSRELVIKLQAIVLENQSKKLAEDGEAGLRLINRLVSRVVDLSRAGTSLERFLSLTCRELRQQLNVDRVAVFKFTKNEMGEFIVEDIQGSWTSLVDYKDSLEIRNTHLQDTQDGHYRSNKTVRVDDIYTANHANHHIELLEQFQAKAYMVAPIFEDNDLWGLLAVYQNSGPRQWEALEETINAQVAAQVGLALEQISTAETLKKSAEREKMVRTIIDQISRVQEPVEIAQVASHTLRRYLQCDRVGVYQFNDDWSGEFIAESVGKEWDAVMELQQRIPKLRENINRCTIQRMGQSNPQNTLLEPVPHADTYFQETQGGRYSRGELYRTTSDIYAENFTPCYIEVLEYYQARAYVIVAVHVDGKLWGLLAVYQNDGPREWQEGEIALVVQTAQQLGLSVQQGNYVTQVQQTLEREKLIRTIIDQISQVQNPVEIAQTASLELKQYLKCDRVGVYQFNSDWSGEFIAEAVSKEWGSVLELQQRVPKLRDNINRCTIQQLGAVVGDGAIQSAMPVDTYMQQTQGGRYSRGELYRVTNDIYSESFPPCYLEVLEYYEAKAYVIVAIHVDGALWGLLATYQNDGPRVWQQSEIDLVVQVAQQLGLAVQQVNYVTQLQASTDQLQTLATQEKAGKEQLQKQIIQMLSAVRPALDGDLTVQVPVTEDAVGTVASAYNNTIDSLRELVTQVKEAATQVQTTSRTSESAIGQLSQQTQKELDDIQRVLNTIQAMVNASRVVSGSAQQMEQAVSQANQTVQEGDRAMNRTVESILAIRETVSDTTKKIKRLGESSQKISKVVSLINNFTTQTNLLALNAAIEATRAGEYGQGFAVVADEVRSLSQQSAEATAEIEALVSEIQEETGAVSQAMDEGIQQVVQGTNLVSETRQSLNAIVQATSQISQLVKGINQAAQTQTQQSDSAIKDMDDLSATAKQTFGKAEEMAIAFQTLLATSETLQASINQFKVK